MIRAKDDPLIQIPHRVRLRLYGANLVFTVLAKDAHEALKLVQEQHPTASVLSAQSSEEIIGMKGSGTWM